MSAPCCPYATAATWITAILGIAGVVLALWLSRSDGNAPPPSQEPAKPAVAGEQ